MAGETLLELQFELAIANSTEKLKLDLEHVIEILSISDMEIEILVHWKIDSDLVVNHSREKVSWGQWISLNIQGL